MVASKYGHTNIIQLLLEHCADANLQNKVSSSANVVCECLQECMIHRRREGASNYVEQHRTRVASLDD